MAERQSGAAILAVLSQKGGVGKSSVARLLAREYAARGRRVLLGDLDPVQATSAGWAERRAAAGIAPPVPVRCFDAVKRLRKSTGDAEVVVVDGRGFADKQTGDIAEAADAVLLPTGLGIDDLEPSVRLAHELVAAGIERRRLVFLLCRAGDNAKEADEARRYVAEAGYLCLKTAWPERAGFRLAHDEGRAATEARHPALRRRARGFADAVLGFTDELIIEKEGKKGP